MDFTSLITPVALNALFSGGGSLYESQRAAERSRSEAEWASRRAEYDARSIEFDTEAAVKKAAFQLKALDQTTALSVENAGRQTAKALGTQRARLGRSGVALDQGSAAQAQAATQAEGDWNVALIRYQAAIKGQELTMDQELTQVRGDLRASMARTLGSYESDRRLMAADEAFERGWGTTAATSLSALGTIARQF
jgi:hypothetical protein